MKRPNNLWLRCVRWCAGGLVPLATGRALACAVCFGSSDSPLAKGMNMGILSLLVVVLGVLAGLVAFFVMLGRRAAAAARAEALLTGAPASATVATCGFLPAQGTLDASALREANAVPTARGKDEVLT